MAKQRDLDDLADYYLKAAGVAAIWIDADGFVGAHGAATIEGEPGCTVYCCERGKHFVLAYQVHEWKQAQGCIPPPDVTAQRLEHIADRLQIGLTKHATAVERARAAVAAVEAAFEKMASTGKIREWNAMFKEARGVDPTLKYATFIGAKKAALLEELARRTIG